MANGSGIEGTGNYFEAPYADIATFGKAPLATEETLREADLAVFGIPWDQTATLRPGARWGPRQIRVESQWFKEAWDPEGAALTSYEARGERVRDSIGIVDCGDVPVIQTDIEATSANVRRLAQRIASETFSLMLGGDHYMTYPTYQGVADAHSDSVVGIIQIDAHADTVDSDPVLGAHWSGTPMRRSMEFASLDPGAIAQIGLRSFTGSARDRGEGIVTFPMRRARELGMEETARRAVSSVLEHCDAIYLTWDIDGVDPAHAPGCCAPTPGGLTSTEIMELMRELGRYHEVIACDLVEVAPPLDPSGMTTFLCAHTLFAFIEQRFMHAAG